MTKPNEAATQTVVREDDQSGRSMIEMLGVLAIIGVLSVGGIAGYSMAMSRFNTTKATEQVQQLFSNVRTLYATQATYADISWDVLIQSAAVPPDMIDGDTDAGVNPWGGDADVAVGSNATEFQITFSEVPQDACIKMVTVDWGSSGGTGLVDILVNGSALAGTPATLAQATSSCQDQANGNAIAWVFN